MDHPDILGEQKYEIFSLKTPITDDGVDHAPDDLVE
jgi:hypothetical protein